jgi:hypothetical protein
MDIRVDWTCSHEPVRFQIGRFAMYVVLGLARCYTTRSKLAGTATVQEERKLIEIPGRSGTVLAQLIRSMLPAQAPYSLTPVYHKV